MKKIIAIAALFLAFSFNANAQTPTAVKGYKVEVITPESIVKDHNALTKLVTMDESLKKDMMTLLNMRMEAVNAAREEDKKAIFDRYGLKLLGGFSKEQLTQLKSNVELYTKLTEY
ncbi:hypothetical protein [Flavobacterium sp.]|jgi:hypothetical protein|uniref:hypothetical protein n=1 Tax=Flavobacterium sp. TaxID=239 RepID=UPI0037C0A6EC